MTEEIVGHKTFSDGHGGFRHEPLSRDEANALWKAVEEQQAQRAALMPDEKAALRMMSDAFARLKELGWSEAMYCPKDGSSFHVIEAGSSGIHDAHYEGEWPTGSWWIADEGDLWPSRPVLFKLYPDDQAKYDAKMAALREKFRDMRNDD